MDDFVRVQPSKAVRNVHGQLAAASARSGTLSSQHNRAPCGLWDSAPAQSLERSHKGCRGPQASILPGRTMLDCAPSTRRYAGAVYHTPAASTGWDWALAPCSTQGPAPTVRPQPAALAAFSSLQLAQCSTQPDSSVL